MDVINYVVSFWNSLSSSEIISYAIGLFGIIVSIIIYYCSKRIQKPRYKKLSSIITEEMISKNSSIHIQHGKKTLERLSITKVAFWNDGITLTNEIIASKSPFRIELKEDNAQILEAYISYAEEENDVSCKIINDVNLITICFDYLSKNQGFVIKVLHTGSGSKALNVKGLMKNSGKLKKSESFYFKYNAILSKLIPTWKLSIYIGYYFILMGIVMVIAGILSYGRVVEAHTESIGNVALIICTGVLTGLIGFYMQKGRLPEKVSKALYDER